MNIDVRFERYIEEHKLFTREDKLLVAVSGGRDSMLLLTLLSRYGGEIAVAHCNFELRAAESDKDEQLVREYCKQLGVKLYVQHFDTEAYAQSHKISIQMAARDLRYAWFEELRAKHGYQYSAIAQHKNDHVETVLFNLSRGTGLLGLQGILPKREGIIRPLLFLNSAEVLQAVEQLKVPYRDDQSNFSNKYARNKIRLDIIPEFERLNPDFIQVMDDNIVRFQETQRVLQVFVEQERKRLFLAMGEEEWQISKAAIEGLDIGLLYFLFEPFGFSKPVLTDLVAAFSAESGRVFRSDSHELLLDRTVLRLRKIEGGSESVALGAEDRGVRWQKYVFSVSYPEDFTVVKDPAIALLDYDKLVFPLTVRAWEEGDVFQPLGMNGKKKISDFFIQRKVSLFDKKKIPIWLNGNGEVLWITNYQIDDRYKITENTQKVLKLDCNI
ncbi:MAG: tRNA lysidine(34) synthetase TilS [Sphingobacterium sp.]|jgi:tRNA(Ile)-lysidine synthase|nr:tRNA lysidine(34) synthetase TilS [Sphingobacterium sp.]